MKLLLITSTFPTPSKPHQGVFNSLMVDSLSKQHDVRVIAPIPWTAGGQSNWKKDSAAKVQHPVFYYPPRILRTTYGFWYWHSIRTCFQKMLSDFKPDLVLGYWAHPDSEAAIRAARSIGVPVVVMVGGSDIRILAKSGRRRRVIQSVLENADQIVAFSKDLAEHVADLEIPKDKINILYRGVDRSQFSPGDQQQSRHLLKVDSDKLILLWVGRFVDVKNPAMAIRILAKLKKKYGDRLMLVMIGEGTLMTAVKKIAVQLDVVANIMFTGAIPHARLQDWYRAADATILTSHSEGVPNVLMESAACNTPFIATDVGGVREIADPLFDRLVPPQDEDQFVAEVVNTLSTSVKHLSRSSLNDSGSLAQSLTAIFERIRR